MKPSKNKCLSNKPRLYVSSCDVLYLIFFCLTRTTKQTPAARTDTAGPFFFGDFLSRPNHQPCPSGRVGNVLRTLRTV